jgi:hypothetical protein
LTPPTHETTENEDSISNDQHSHCTEADADEAPHHNEEEEERTQAQHSRRQRRRDTRDAVIGTNNSAGEIQAAEERAWLYVGKLEKSIMAENVIAYMSKRGIQGNIECDELKTLGDKKAFKVGLNPCGGGVEYLHRDPASRKRRRNGAKKGRAIA